MTIARSEHCEHARVTVICLRDWCRWHWSSNFWYISI